MHYLGYSMKRNAILHLIVLLSLFALPATAQQYFFQTFGQREGIPVSTINDIAEDPLGFMWVATEGGGLARFDGVSSTVFTTEDGLPSNYVTSLKSDGGTLLVGTDKGLTSYDGYRFVKRWELPDERVVAITQWNEDWIVVFRRSLYRIDADDEVIRMEIPGEPQLMSVDYTEQSLFIGASDGLWKYTGDEWVKWWDGTNARSIFIIDRTDEESGVQVGASDDVYLVLRKGLAIPNLSTNDDLGSHPDVRDIVLDSRGRWWYGSYQQGLRRYDSRLAEDFRGVKVGEEEGLITPKIRCLHVSSDGRIWIGGLSGLSRLVEPDLYRYTEDDGLLDERVHAVTVSSRGNWWMGGLAGLSKKNKYGEIESFTESSGLPRGLVFDVVESRNGRIYVASEAGLAQWDGSRFRTYGVDAGLGNAFIFDLEPLANGDLAVATTSGIYIFDRGQFSTLDENLTTTAIPRIQEDGEGRLWALDIEGRIMKLERGEWSYAFNEEEMLRIAPATFQVDGEGTLWMGTNGFGLWRLKEGKLDSLSSKEGLLSDNVWSLNVLDNDVWIGTERGIQNIIWNGKWEFGTRVSDARGFGELECNPHAVTRDEESIIFGTNQGVLVAPLRNVEERPSFGVIEITRLDLFFEQPESWEEWSDSIKPWSQVPLNLDLPYDQNYLRFAYSALQVADPLALRYEYRLSPLNQNWTEAEGRREAIYTSVPSGKYTFQVRAFDPLSGKLIESEEYHFEIRRPYWTTWWFYVSVVLVLSGSVYLYIRVRLKRIKERLALEEERNDLERRALRLQMNPHFVFNALDAISGFIFKNEPKEAVKYLNKFAKLMRLMLESSREHMIPLHTEIQLLENYLALEKLRFSGEFESEILLDDEIDTYGYSLPSMMIQPHVENAILHGLRPKGGGLVKVSFEMSNGGIRCVVEDDGIGRRKAAEIREKSGRKHRSLAGEISRRRVELFERTYGGQSAVMTEDLFDEEGVPAGTRVILQLPIQSTDEWEDD